MEVIISVLNEILYMLFHMTFQQFVMLASTIFVIFLINCVDIILELKITPIDATRKIMKEILGWPSIIGKIASCVLGVIIAYNVVPVFVWVIIASMAILYFAIKFLYTEMRKSLRIKVDDSPSENIFGVAKCHQPKVTKVEPINEDEHNLMFVFIDDEYVIIDKPLSM